MRPEAAEHDRAENEDSEGDDPEVGGQFIVPLPEPDMVDKTLPIAFDDVIDRVELDHVEVLGGEDLG